MPFAYYYLFMRTNFVKTMEKIFLKPKKTENDSKTPPGAKNLRLPRGEVAERKLRLHNR